jgi:uncharacterized membrane protein (UPF0127 family)
MKDHPTSIHNLNNPKTAPVHAKWCESFLCRLRGYTFRKELTQQEGLLLVEKRDSRIDSSIHMMFCWTDLAVVWINADLTVVDVILAKKWAPAYFPAQPAKYTLEIHPSRLNDFKPGDKVEIKHEI